MTMCGLSKQLVGPGRLPPFITFVGFRAILYLNFDTDVSHIGVLINCNTATFLTGSALIPLGLTWWQAVICESSSSQLFGRHQRI